LTNRMTLARIGLGVLGAFIVLMPFVPKYGPLIIHVGSLIGIMSIVTLGYHIFFGFTGQINFGMNGFYACGAYATALLIRHTGLHYFAVIPIALAITVMVTLVIGLAVLRLREWVLGLGTCCFGFAALLTVRTIATGFFGGDDGIDLPALTLGGWAATPLFFYYFIMGWVVVCTLLTHFLGKSRVGRAFKAIREDEVAASAMGVNVDHYVRISFLVCGVFGGLAGILYAQWNQWIAPASVTLEVSILPMVATVVGGVGSTAGAILGTVILKILPEVFISLREYRVLMEALVLFLVVRFASQGIVGGLRRLFLWQQAFAGRRTALEPDLNRTR